MVQLAQAQPVLPATDPKQPEVRQRPAAPFPDAGETPAFRYTRDQGDMYLIIPTDGSPSYSVSASFLQTTLGNGRLTNAQQAELLQAHTSLMQEMFRATYPDAAVQYPAPFASQSFTGTDGTQVLLTQDPVAGPYVRVSLTGGRGQPEEFSMGRGTVEQILANTQLTNDQRLAGLRSFPGRLPEAARAGDFSRVSAAELARLVQQQPGMRQHLFVQMAPLSAAPPRQAGVAPPGAPGGLPPGSELAPLPFQGSQLGSPAPGSNGPSQPVAGTVRAEPADGSTSAWGRAAPYIAVLSLVISGLMVIVISFYRISFDRR